jgi:hypothetical protein
MNVKKILVTIAHFFQTNENPKYGSQGANPQWRIIALNNCLNSLRQQFSQSQYIIDIGQKVALSANQPQAYELDIVICTTQNCHILDRLPVPPEFYKHNPTNAEPMLLGFECQAVLRDCLDRYDYYCFLEDDLTIHDPWFFLKLDWFTKQTDNINLLQPNRYEIADRGLVSKAYIDGDLAFRVTAPFQNANEVTEIRGNLMGNNITFRRALNPHSGCYFLNANQMAHWASQSYFLDRDTSFVGPLESAATLGIMKTFRVYKTAPEYAGFLEINHFGNRFLSLIGNVVKFS